jgi:hypothetical protein
MEVDVLDTTSRLTWLHGSRWLMVIPAEIEHERHSHGAGRSHVHQHIKVR